MKLKEMRKCKKCGHSGHVVNIKGLCYAQCTHCSKWGPYQFLGFNESCAIDVWNTYNSSGKIIEE